MGGDDSFRTRMGQRFFEATMPKIADQHELQKRREAPATTTLPMQRPDDSR